MSDESLESALLDEAARLDAEDSAGESRAEKAGKAAAKNPKPQAPGAVEAAAPAPSPTETKVAAMNAVLDSLGPEAVAGFAVVALDILVTKAFGPKAKLTVDERMQLAKAAVPALVYYLPKLEAHPLLPLAIVGTAIYGSKALPEGVALEALLGGVAKSAAPQGPPPAQVAA